MDEHWTSASYQPNLKCLACGALGGLTWQNVVNRTKQRTIIFMTCACGFRYELARQTEPDDFRRWETPQPVRGSGITTEQHKRLADLNEFIDKDQEE